MRGPSAIGRDRGMQEAPGGRSPAPLAGAQHGCPTCCSLPGMLWLVVFFVAADDHARRRSRCRTGDVDDGYTLHLATSPSTPTRCRRYWPQLLRSLVYAATATVLGPAARLPARLLHRAQVGPVEERPAGARHRAVLHQLPDPHAGLADDPVRQRRRWPGSPTDHPDFTDLLQAVRPRPTTTSCSSRRSR